MTDDEQRFADEARPASGTSLPDLLRELPGAFVDHDASAGGAGSAVVYGVQHDSRRVQPGDLFVARKGASFDGGRFVQAAAEKGAAAILAASDLPLDGVLPVPVIRVPDLPQAFALAAAAVYGHPSFALDMVGVTGTNGKTTVTHLVRAAVDAAVGTAACGIVGTVGHAFAGRTIAASHTTPEADELARLLAVMRRRGATHVAMEVSSIALVLGRVLAVRFRVAAFTNLTQDHLDFHGTMDAYGAAKAKLFTELGPGLAVVNVDDPFGARLAGEARCKVLTVSTDPASRADVAPRRIDALPDGMRVVARTPAGDVEIATRLFGRHNVENLLVALGTAVALELDVTRAAAGLAKEGGAPGRLERCDEAGDDIVVLVDYAHTPDAIARVLSAVREARSAAGAPGRVLAVFGCGGDRDPKKRGPMGEAAALGADVAIVTSDNPRTEDPRDIAVPVERAVVAAGKKKIAAAAASGGESGYLVELERSAAIELAVSCARPGDVVVVLGKGHEDYQIVGSEKRHFDDREEARRALERRRAGAGGS